MFRNYTSQEMRKMASAVLDECEDSEHGLLYPSRYFSGHLFYPDSVADMLRQAADILDSIRNEISTIEKMPTANLDGSFYNQKINGERLMAKIAFYQKVKEIVEEVSNG